MRLWIACIVEGHGETSALPVLLRRIAASIDSAIDLDIPSPIRMQRSKLGIPGELEKAVQLAAGKVAPHERILILMDADDDCPATLAPALLERAQASRSDLPIAVVIANREFESGFWRRPNPCAPAFARPWNHRRLRKRRRFAEQKSG